MLRLVIGLLFMDALYLGLLSLNFSNIAGNQARELAVYILGGILALLTLWGCVKVSQLAKNDDGSGSRF